MYYLPSYDVPIIGSGTLKWPAISIEKVVDWAESLDEEVGTESIGAGASCHR